MTRENPGHSISTPAAHVDGDILVRLETEIRKYADLCGNLPIGHFESVLRAAHDEIERLRSSQPEGGVKREDIIEECARVCDLLAGLSVQGWGRKCTSAAQKCATEIRALK